MDSPLGTLGTQDETESQLPQSYVGVLATPDGRTGVIVSSLRHGAHALAATLAVDTALPFLRPA